MAGFSVVASSDGYAPRNGQKSGFVTGGSRGGVILKSTSKCICSNYFDGHDQVLKMAPPDLMIAAYRGGQCHAGTQPGQPHDPR